MARNGQRRSEDAQGPQASTINAVTESAASPAPKRGKSATAKPNASKGNGSINSFEIFRCCIERSKNLLKIHEAAHGKKAKPERYLADAHRAAIVLAISALDAFIRSFVITHILSLVSDKTATLPGSLADRIKSFLKEDALLEAARKDDLLDRVEKAFQKDFETKSFQGTRQISESLKLVGYDDIFHSVAISAEENEDTLRERIDRFTIRRHTIAHRGDYDISQNPPREHPITKKEAQECIKIVILVATHINTLGAKS